MVAGLTTGGRDVEEGPLGAGPRSGQPGRGRGSGGVPLAMAAAGMRVVVALEGPGPTSGAAYYLPSSG